MARPPVTRQRWELSHDDLSTTKLLGIGAHGEMHAGVWRTNGKRGDVNVAIRLANLGNLTKEQIREIFREARLMRIFECDYVLRLWGVAAARDPLMIAMELASDGPLNSYLEKNQVDETQKAVMCLQSSWGIEYLHSKNIIHRDIAARNCMYGDGKVKISDFGMSREGPIYHTDPKRRLPIRWLAPETMRVQTYTFKTDVYSYGIMCWEIYHNGKEPFPGLTPAENETWVDDPNSRLTQDQISRKLELIQGTPRPDFEAEARKRREADESEERERASSQSKTKSLNATSASDGGISGEGKKKDKNEK